MLPDLLNLESDPFLLTCNELAWLYFHIPVFKNDFGLVLPIWSEYLSINMPFLYNLHCIMFVRIVPALAFQTGRIASWVIFDPNASFNAASQVRSFHCRLKVDCLNEVNSSVMGEIFNLFSVNLNESLPNVSLLGFISVLSPNWKVFKKKRV